jgi:diguanylate cyclase (GGDEF)-like protein
LIIILSIAVILIISLAMYLAIVDVNEKMNTYCLEKLEAASHKLADTLKTGILHNRSVISALAHIIQDSTDLDDQGILDVLNAFILSPSLITCFEYLDDKGLLLQSGERISAEGFLDFEAEKTKGPHLSRRLSNPLDNGRYEIRQVYPVCKDGQVAGILYGVTKLDMLPGVLSTEILDNQAYVYIIDSQTGDFLMDTWHSELTNLSDFSTRQAADNNGSQIGLDMRAGNSGHARYYSKTTGEVLYIYYAPTTVNDLSVAITVSEAVAFKEAESIKDSLMTAIIIMLSVLVLYIVLLAVNMDRAFLKARRMGLEDKVTGLQNRNAFEKLKSETQKKEFASLTCAYVDVNSLHDINNFYGHVYGDELLQCIADAMKAEFEPKEIFRVGGDEFIILSERLSREEVLHKLGLVDQKARMKGKGISFSVVQRHGEKGVFTITKNADAIMLKNKKAYHSRDSR